MRHQEIINDQLTSGGIEEVPSFGQNDMLPTDSSLPHFQAEVVACSLGELISNRRGSIQEYLFEMSDGTTYPAVVGRPYLGMTRSDTAVVFTNAWLTSTKGHNRRTLLRMMETGYPVIMIGTEDEEKNPRQAIDKRLKSAATGNLFKSSHDINRVLDYILPTVDVRQDEIITLGESRGAMKAAAFNVEQYSGPRQVVYADLTAPCFARAPHLAEVPQGLFQLAKEATVLGRLGLQLVLQPRGRHYIGTVRRDPEYYARELCKLPNLLSGQAGKLACATRDTTPMHIRLFKNDSWSQHEEWSKIYGNRPMVYLERTKGTHLDIAGSETLDNIELRLRALSEARGFSGSFQSVDFKPIIALHSYTQSAKSDEAIPMDLAA